MTRHDLGRSFLFALRSRPGMSSVGSAASPTLRRGRTAPGPVYCRVIVALTRQSAGSCTAPRWLNLLSTPSRMPSRGECA